MCKYQTVQNKKVYQNNSGGNRDQIKIKNFTRILFSFLYKYLSEKETRQWKCYFAVRNIYMQNKIVALLIKWQKISILYSNVWSTSIPEAVDSAVYCISETVRHRKVKSRVRLCTSTVLVKIAKVASNFAQKLAVSRGFMLKYGQVTRPLSMRNKALIK
jgi:hypothetical protein